jgi:hypothetical protein
MSRFILLTFVSFGVSIYNSQSFLEIMCGILGLLLHEPSGQACTELFEGLGYLQHRGQVDVYVSA